MKIKEDPESHNIQNVHNMIQNPLLYLNQENQEWAKTINTKSSTNTKLNQMLELPDNDYPAAVEKMLQEAISNSLETSEK